MSPSFPTVFLWSFSYHQGGPPADDSLHGGGFVFDCRGLPNPHFEPQLREQSGRDASVVAWLEQQTTVEHFSVAVHTLVMQTIQAYAQLGRNRLMVCFGCTGGRHRSVFLAEQLAKQLRQAQVPVQLQHRELTPPDTASQEAP